MQNAEDKDIENILKLLDGFCTAEESRLKLNVQDDLPPESTSRSYHHGRCDVGSPWAKGTAFDVLE